MDSKDAVKRAREFLAEHYNDIDDVLLEEIERTESGDTWLITLSFRRPRAPANRLGLGQALDGVLQRYYRQLTVDATGEVRSMKIREFRQYA